MDIHDTTGATAEDIAAAHQMDIVYQDEFNCQFIYFWHDLPNNTGFCVFEAPDKKSLINLHNKTHVTIKHNQIIEVQLSEIEFFLGKITDIAWSKKNPPFDGYINETAHRTIMYLEMYYPLILKLQINKDKYTELVNRQKKIIKDSYLKYDGKLISWENGYVLASFMSDENAINCCADVQNNLNDISKKQNAKFSISMGLNFGAPVTKSDNLFGDVISQAKKLGYFAGENQTLVSSSLSKTYNELKIRTGFNNGFIKVLNSRNENFLNLLFDSLEKNWNKEEFRIDSLVTQFGMSRAQLYRKLIDLTGYSPNNFIREIRLKKALKLIEAHQGNITEIAYEAGFNNPSYFSKCFQRKFGLLPSEFASSIV
jgi:AraC-like DNA-binding protein